MPVPHRDFVERRHPRHPVRIPVLVEVAHVWESAQGRAAQGTLCNISRDGGALRMSWVVPPRTQLRVSVPMTPTNLLFKADVVWTSLAPGGSAEAALYGVRWLEFISGRSLEAVAQSSGLPRGEH